ncbi:hypothetical protein EX30DRAFT_305706 [Ascodesmis nigricans]|uniref:PhoD-like phosphatase domain-containing protein n=1 Tax=Ascodesmis nigricans TaxID=341454 RepID=A0A4S2MYR8_9PEZI|nr:hypothetical protein EX30DRAFT_305706 [Ascodesmis nigricans]
MSYLRAIPPRKVPDRKQFSPSLGIRCGPLLRYTGLRHNNSNSLSERETWRGSIMIVTIDGSSNYSRPPSARIFRVDPATGTIIGDPSVAVSHGKRNSKSGHRSRKQSRSGERVGKYREVEGFKLHSQRGHTFWRFIIEIDLVESEAKIGYRINKGPPTYFWVPARNQPMNIMFHSCNGFTMGTNPTEFSGADPLWDDVLVKHKEKPFHVMLGGGDQVYNDSIAKQTKHFQAWLNIKIPFQKSGTEFSTEMAYELEEYYFERYSYWFAQGSFGVANAQIPMVNIWDDHDIIDGFGSYPNHFNRCPVFTGLGAVAFKYYMLFQHQSTLDEKEQHEPSWLMGSGPGPYIAERSRSVFMFLGRPIAFLGIDCRTERMKDIIIAPHTYERIFARLKKEIVPGETKHLIVLCGVPLAYPRLVWLENLLTSKIMDPVKALARRGILGSFVNNFDGGVELLDDLDDHWTAKNHKIERNHFIQKLQRFAAETSVRVTILSGDVHLSGIGQFMSNPRLNIPKIKDYRYIANVISSAIVNGPPPNAMADLLNKRNKVHHLDLETDEDMFPLFLRDVDNSTRSNKRLMPRRNYCTISMFDLQNPSAASLDMGRARKSTFRRPKKQASPKSAKSATNLPQNATLDGVSDSKEAAGLSELMKDSLHVTIRVEVDQKDPSRGTKPYRFLIPALDVNEELTAEKQERDMAKSI